jgi:YHS domain-containing protein
VRLAILAAWIAVAVVAILPLLRRRMPSPPPRPITSDELVKDPVCGIYIVRSRAVNRTVSGAARHFCSVECANRFGG